jgi:hypothetical protein
MTKRLDEMSDAERAAEYRRRRIEDEQPLGTDPYGNVVLSREKRPMVVEVYGDEEGDAPDHRTAVTSLVKLF